MHQWKGKHAVQVDSQVDSPSQGKRRLVFVMDKPEPPRVPFAPLMMCPACGTEMRLLGIESENRTRDLYTFECPKCGRLEVRGVSTV